jgi:hypothetical protein
MKKNKFILPVLFLLLFAAYYGILKVIPADYNDMHDHAAFARQMCRGEIPYTGNFMVYLLVNVFSFFTAKVTSTEISLCFLLAFAGTYRYYLTQKKISEVVGNGNNIILSDWLMPILAVSMLFIFAIPIPSYFAGDYYMYIGNYVPNVWHNSTILFLFPFAMLLFDVSYKQIQFYNAKRNWLILGLILLNLFIKPSYFFVFLCVYPLFLLFSYHFKKEFWISLLPLIVGFFILILQYWIIYKIGSSKAKEASSVVFLPFYKNPEFENLASIPVAMFFSLSFPVLYSLFNFRKVIHNQLFWYILLSFVVSVLIFYFISESGPRASHGNFYWQIVITSWLAFFITLLALLSDMKLEGKTFKNKLLLFSFSAHVLMGVVYFIRILVTGGYY